MNLKYRKDVPKDVYGATEEAESQALTDKLVNMVMSDVIREDKANNDVRDYFKKWKF